MENKIVTRSFVRKQSKSMDLDESPADAIRTTTDPAPLLTPAELKRQQTTLLALAKEEKAIAKSNAANDKRLKASARKAEALAARNLAKVQKLEAAKKAAADKRRVGFERLNSGIFNY
jgi:hypothetical protein